jgi:sensory rhodopsin
MVVEEQTLYASAATITLVAAVVALLLVTRFEGDVRKHMLTMPGILGILTLGYVGMALDVFSLTSPDGAPVYLTRYGAYLITYTFTMSYLGLVSGAPRRYRVVPAVSVVGFSLGAIMTQLGTPPVDSLGTLLVVSSLAVVFWVFFRPFTRELTSVSGDRRLLFSKMRNLATLTFVMYLLAAMTNRTALGLLDGFTGVITVAYVDLTAHIVFAGLIISSEGAIRTLVTDHSSPLATFTEGDS